MSQSHIRYRLEGESLAAAKTAEDFINKKTRHLAWDDRTAAFIVAHPAEAAVLGLDHPTVQAGDCGGRLRAYQTVPTLYHANDKIFYLDCPIAHDGKHFTPKDALPLDAQAEEKSWRYFSAGMGEGISPVLHIKPEGVAAPATASHLSEDVDYGGRNLPIAMWGSASTYVYFPDAKTLAALKVFETENVAYTKAVDDLTRAVSGIIDVLAPKMQERQDKKSAIRPTLYFNDAEKYLNVRLDNAYLPDHPALDIKDSKGHSSEMVFKLRPNTATAEGQQLASLFNAIGQRPSLAQKLGLPDSAYPHFEDIDGQKRLLTRTPVASLVVDTEKDWILRDKQDADYKVKAPPRPF